VRLTSKLGTYLRLSVVVVDQVGYQPLERTEANLVISKRYEKGSIILTSNPWAWASLVGCPRSATWRSYSQASWNSRSRA
jgi:hypothetical protein